MGRGAPRPPDRSAAQSCRGGPAGGLRFDALAIASTSPRPLALWVRGVPFPGAIADLAVALAERRTTMLSG